MLVYALVAALSMHTGCYACSAVPQHIDLALSLQENHVPVLPYKTFKLALSSWVTQCLSVCLAGMPDCHV